jgi:hypothetical protein
MAPSPLAGDLQFLEGAHLDLTHSFMRDAELVRQFAQPGRAVGEPARLDDTPFAAVEHGERLAERLAPATALFILHYYLFRARCLIDQQVLPFVGYVVAGRGIERRVADDSCRLRSVGERQAVSDQLDLIGRMSPASGAEIFRFALPRLKNSFFSIAVVPSSRATTSGRRIP